MEKHNSEQKNISIGRMNLQKKSNINPTEGRNGKRALFIAEETFRRESDKAFRLNTHKQQGDTTLELGKRGDKSTIPGHNPKDIDRKLTAVFVWFTHLVWASLCLYLTFT